MPAQAVVSASMAVRYDGCPHCRMVGTVIRLKLLLEGLTGDTHITWEGCPNCVQADPVNLSIKPSAKDIIDLPTKATRRSQNKKARRREERAAEHIGGRRVAGSGSQECKGDARNDGWMVEDKHTSGKTFTLSNAILSKAVGQASKTGRNAVIRVGLTDGTELAVCLWSDFVEVISE